MVEIEACAFGRLVQAFLKVCVALVTAEGVELLATAEFCVLVIDCEIFSRFCRLGAHTFSCIPSASIGLDLFLRLPVTSCPSTRW